MDSTGNIIVIGWFDSTIDFGGGPLVNSTPAYIDTFVAKLDPAGDYLWSKRFGDTQAPFITGVAPDGAEDVVVAGTFSGTIDLGGGELAATGMTDIFLAKLRTP